jgi:Holliday junction resolvase RusA-like endonuclease
VPTCLSTKDYLFSATVDGSLPSMKNQRRIVLNKATGKPFSIKSKKAEDYATSFMYQIGQKCPKKPITADLSLRVRVWYPSKKNDLDIEFLCDLLEKTGIIANDRQIKHKEATHCGVDKVNPRVIFTLYEVKGGE